jgi:hypothetical protein
MWGVSYIRMYNGRVKATFVILGITARLFVRGVSCNNLDYNIELVCVSCY